MSLFGYIDLVGSIKVGEVGEKNVEIQESVTDLRFLMASNSVSEIQLKVHDPGFRMHNANYFMIGRTVTYNDSVYEIAAIEVKHGSRDETFFTARLAATQKLRTDKGQKNFGTISPSIFAQNVARGVGLEFFGEATAVDGQIVREAKDNKDESTFDVLQRLARKADFLCFESKGILFFASEKEIIAKQPSFTVTVPSDSDDGFFVNSMSVRRTVDGEKAATVSIEFLKTEASLSIFPGTVVEVEGISNFSKFMVDKVSYNGSPSGPVSISGTSPEDTDDMSCEIKTFQYGSRDECVKRLQEAVGTIVDGWWGPMTNAAVLKFQRANGLPADGIWNSDDWAKIKGS